MNKYYSTLFCLLISVVGHAQKLSLDVDDYYLKQTVSLWRDTLKIQAHILAEDEKVKIKDNIMYFWYKGGNIHHTRGAVSGKVLHGDYIEYFGDDNLRAKGCFVLGIRVGNWKTWHHNGEIASITQYKKGVEDGTFVEFDSTGTITRKGDFKKGELDGKVFIYKDEKVAEVQKYKDGKLKKEKKKRWWKREEKKEDKATKKEAKKKTKAEKKKKKQEEKEAKKKKRQEDKAEKKQQKADNKKTKKQ